MTAIEQIRAAASNGLTAAEIEAGIIRRSMTDAERTAYHAARGHWKLKEAQRKAQKKAAGAMSIAENSRRWTEKQYNLEPKIKEAVAAQTTAQLRRRRRALSSLYDFICTYGVGSICDYAPPKEMRPTLDTMESVATEAGKYQIMMSRGFGKTTFVTALAVYMAVNGVYSFVEIIGATDDKAKDIFKTMMCIFEGEAFREDFPALAIPFKEADGNSIRMARLTYGGEKVKMEQTANHCILPTIPGEVWSGAKFVIRGITARNLRGLNIKGDRPDFIILDDVQTDAMAKNPQQIRDTLKTINQTIRGQFAHHKSGTMIMTATPILTGDLTEQIKDDPAWITKVYPMMRSMPTNREAWDEYAKVLRAETAALAIGEKPKQTANAYYKKHRKTLDDGGEPFSPHTFNRANELSAIQHAMNIIFGSNDGEEVFAAEYQMNPRRTATVYEISYKNVLQNANNVPMLTVPRGLTRIVASVDVMNTAGLRWEIMAIGANRTCAVIGYGRWPANNEPIYNPTDAKAIRDTKIVNAIEELTDELSGRFFVGQDGQRYSIGAIGIDSGWLTRPIYAFCTAHPKCIAMKGVPWQSFRPRNLRGEILPGIIEATDWCYERDVGYGRFLAFHSDFWRETAQRSWFKAPLQRESLSVNGDAVDHLQFAQENVADMLVEKDKTRAGVETWKWSCNSANHLGDCTTMCLALAHWKRAYSVGGDSDARSVDAPSAPIQEGKLPTFAQLRAARMTQCI